MQNEFDNILNRMNVREDRKNAVEKAIQFYNKGNNALEYLIDLGLKLKKKENRVNAHGNLFRGVGTSRIPNWRRN